MDRWAAESRAATSRLTPVEVASAVSRRVRRGDLSPSASRRVLTSLLADAESLAFVELSEDVTRRALRLLVEHDLRAGDAVQLASCLFLSEATGRRVEMVCFDARLVVAARTEGVPVLGG